MNKKAVFICQIMEGSIKVVKCLTNGGHKRELACLEYHKVPVDADDKVITDALKQALRKAGYANNPIILSLPRSQATCRYIKIPSNDPKEIDRIALLQAPRYFPYQADELVSGYQVISIDKEGYSDINLTIVHKDLIERYQRILRGLKPEKISVTLSSYGLLNLYSYIEPVRELAPVMLAAIDSTQVELAVVFNRKLLFSRAFKLDTLKPQWESLFIDEINKTKDAYLKESGHNPPAKIVILGEEAMAGEISGLLNKHASYIVKALAYRDSLNSSKDLWKDVSDYSGSFAGMIGLGIQDVEKSLNLAPYSVREKERKKSIRKDKVKAFVSIAGIIFILAMGIAKNFDNKYKYLEELKIELNETRESAKGLEDMEARSTMLEERLIKRPSIQDVIYTLHKIVPDQVNLANFIYEEDGEVVLRGQAKELDSVFMLVSGLEKSEAFRDFSIKVRYAAKKVSQSGEIVDFELACLKR